MCHHSASHSPPGDHADRATHTIPHATANAATDAAANAATQTLGPGGPLQLRRGGSKHLDSGQDGMVLPHSPRWVPPSASARANANACANANCSASRAV